MALPTGYVELEYIESTGTQYIDTGFKPNNQTRFIIKSKYTQTSPPTTNLHGVRNKIGDGTSAFGIGIETANRKIGYFFGAFVNTGQDLDNEIHTYELSQSGWYYDGAKSATPATKTFQTSYTFFLNAWNNGASGILAFPCELYSCQFYDNGSLIRNFIPCKNPDGTIGLYDTVGNKFYTNAGTGVFLSGPEATEKKYIELEYIESSGTQYIDTAYIANNTTKIEASCDITYSESWAKILGSYDSGGYFSWWAKSNVLYAYYGKQNKTIQWKAGKISLVSNGAVWSMDNTSVVFSDETISPGDTVLIFSIKGGGVYDNASMKLYSFRVYDNGTLIRDFIPAKLPTGEIGLYDLTNDLFFGNSGTGVFIAGPEIPTDPASPVTNFSVLAISQKAILVGWAYSEHAVSYNVYLDDILYTNSQGPFQLIDGLTPNTFYTISIAATNGQEEAEKVSIPVSTIDYLDLITDRTASETGNTSKGFYFSNDLNRVGYAIDYLKDWLYSFGYSLETSPKKDWTMEDIPSKAQMEHYLEDINTIKSMLTRINGEGPEPPETMRFLRWNKANDIEQILVNLEENLNRIPPAYFYSNEIFAGELY